MVFRYTGLGCQCFEIDFLVDVLVNKRECVLYTFVMEWSQNMPEAIKWLKKAAEQGNADALILLEYYTASTVKDGLEILHKFAKQGNPFAQYTLGTLYATGRGGVEKNFAEGFKWVRKAAEQGLAAAQYDIGECYEYGEGVPENYYQAIDWYYEAANQGELRALKALKRLWD